MAEDIAKEMEELRQILQQFVIHHINCPLCGSPIVVKSNEAYQRIRDLAGKVFPSPSEKETE